MNVSEPELSSTNGFGVGGRDGDSSGTFPVVTDSDCTQAERPAAQTRAAAAAFGTAFAATVPPELVAANRNRLAVLVRTLA